MNRWIWLSATVLCTLLVSCSAASPSADPPDAEDPAIAGVWRNGGVTTDGFYDPVTDTWTWDDPDGTGAAFEFTSDGRYVHVTLVRFSTVGHCFTTYSTYQQGSMSLGDEELLLTPALFRSRREYSCTPERVDEDSALPGPGRYAWRLASEGGETVLQLSDLASEGAGWSTYYR